MVGRDVHYARNGDVSIAYQMVHPSIRIRCASHRPNPS
jgi:hypothetical protein